MSDEDSSFDELVEEHQTDGTGRGRRRARKRRGGFLRSVLPAFLVLVVVVGIGWGGYTGYRWLTSNVSLEAEETDFPGPGSGEAIVEVAEGDTGTDIAKTLVDAGVIKSTGPFINLFSSTADASGIEPGVYRLKLEMSSADALNALLDPANLAGHRVIIPEGLRLTQTWPLLSDATDIPVEDFEAAAEDYTAYGIPENPAGNLEGYLWPGRYDIPEDATAEQVIQMMWDRMEQQLTDRGIAEADWHRTLTLASLAELEANKEEDYGKVVRVILNRLEGAGEAGGTPMPLQFDSTVHYVAGKNSAVATTNEERAIDSPYNTYKYTGLPPGPIAAPGGPALDAAVNPPAGDWLYFVTVNTDTGETRFAATWAEHEENVAAWREWAQSK